MSMQEMNETRTTCVAPFSSTLSMTREKASLLFRSLRGCSAPQLRLFIFPYAGGSTSAFRNWPKHLPSSIEIRSLELAGHDTRFQEEASTNWEQIVSESSAAIAALVEVPIVFFGHSMGSMLAFETARTLRRTYGIGLEACIVSGRSAPQMVSRTPSLGHLASKVLVRKLSELYGGIPEEALADEELVELMARVLRADLAVVDGYRYAPDEPLPCPMAAFGGKADPWVTEEELSLWGRQTSGEFYVEQFAGDHFYLRDETAGHILLQRIETICATAVHSPGRIGLPHQG